MWMPQFNSDMGKRGHFLRKWWRNGPEYGKRACEDQWKEVKVFILEEGFTETENCFQIQQDSV